MIVIVICIYKQRQRDGGGNMTLAQWIDFRDWANMRVNVDTLRNRISFKTDYHLMEDVANKLARDYQVLPVFAESVKGFGIKEIVGAVADLKNESMNYVCGVCI